MIGRLVEALDLRRLAQFGDEVGLRLACQEGLDLVLHLLEFRRLLGALVLDLDNVPAELRLHRVRQLPRIHLESDIGEFRHHLILGEEAEVAALGRARILGFLLGEGREIGAALELIEDGLRLVLVLDQDVARVHLLLAAHGLHGVIVGLVQGIVGESGLGLVLQLVPHQKLVAQERQPSLELGSVGELLLVGGLRDHDDVGKIGDQVLALGLRRGCLHIGAHVLLREREIALRDIHSVDARNDRVRPGRRRLGGGVFRASRGNRQDEQQSRKGGERDRTPARRRSRQQIGGHDVVLIRRASEARRTVR